MFRDVMGKLQQRFYRPSRAKTSNITLRFDTVTKLTQLAKRAALESGYGCVVL
jgi:hypothetical protein